MATQKNQINAALQIYANANKPRNVLAQPGIFDRELASGAANFVAPPMGMFSGGKKASSGDPWYLDLLNGINAAGRVATSGLYKADNGKGLDKMVFDAVFGGQGKFQAPDLSKGFQLPDYGKGLKDAFSGGLLPWSLDTQHIKDAMNDPDRNFLSALGSDAHGHGSADILKDKYGVTNKTGLLVGGIIGDIASDPLNFLTFGAGSVTKAGTAAARTTAREMAAQFGVKVGGAAEKEVDAIAKAARDIAYKQARSQGATVLDAFNDASKAKYGVVDAVNNARNGAMNTAKNALINFNVPLTNITTSVGRKPAWIAKVSPKIGKVGAAKVTEVLDRLGVKPVDVKKILNNNYGVKDVTDMTVDQYKHLQESLHRYNKQIDRTQQFGKPLLDMNNLVGDPTTINSVKHILEEASKNRDMLFHAPGMIRDTGKSVEKILKDSVTNNAAPGFLKQAQAQVRKSYSDLADSVHAQLPKLEVGKYAGSPGGRSRLTDYILHKTRLDKTFNPRHLGVKGEGVVNDAANVIQDSKNAIYGKTRQAELEIRNIQKTFGKLSDAENDAVIFALEGKTPKGYNPPADLDMKRVNDVADRLRQSFSRIARNEQSAGILDNVRENYFTHIKNFDDAEIAKFDELFKDDKHLQGLLKNSSNNQFNKQRQYYDTLADLDDYAATLPKEKADALTNFFKRDPVEVLVRRTFDSIKRVEMKNMQKKLAENGIISDTKVTDAFHHIDAKDAKTLGLTEGRYIQQDVYKAMTRLNDVFTSEGINDMLSRAEFVLNTWKAVVTVNRPIHHINNLVGNVLNNALAGVDVESYGEAAGYYKRLKGYDKKIQAGNMTKQEKAQFKEDMQLFKESLELGIIHSGWDAEITKMFKSTKSTSFLEKVQDVSRNNVWAKFLQKYIGSNTDNITRMAHYIDMKSKLGSPEKAAESVRKYLFNYNEVTTGDRTMRLAVPFWNWTKRNIPLQIEKLAQNPAFYGNYQKITNNTFGSAGEDLDGQSDFIKEGYMVNPLTGELRNPRAPMTDLAQLGNPLKMAITSSNPFIKAAFETQANHNYFTEKPIDYSLKYKGKRDPKAWGEYAMNQTGIFNDLYKLASDENYNIFDLLFGRELEVR